MSIGAVGVEEASRGPACVPAVLLGKWLPLASVFIAGETTPSIAPETEVVPVCA